MVSVRRKVLAGAGVLAAATGYLAFAGLRSGWVYYESVETFAARVDAGGGNVRARVRGVVGEGAEIRGAELIASFDLVGAGARVRVEYRGAVPEGLAPGRDVVVEGRLGTDGVFHADTLMTKCASKYEADAAPGGHG